MVAINGDIVAQGVQFSVNDVVRMVNRLICSETPPARLVLQVMVSGLLASVTVQRTDNSSPR